ncbi:MAG TPA: sigma-70 family RNA polymerase sigma factor [Pyrinomonadaceae bacterium]|nr:sigma-70 family RNA polymerase sigma factor [Pyrinomonadaceae bacterium]
MDDAEAIKKCQLGDREAFRHLVERYQKRAVAHAMAVLLDRDDAEDAVQEAFIDAFKAIGRFDTSRTFYQWFYVLLRNRCYKLTAKRQPTENLDDVQLLAAQREDDTRFALEKALHSLTHEEREIVSLKYFSGLSYDELAAHLQIPRGTVMSRLFYARKRLQGKLRGVLIREQEV